MACALLRTAPLTGLIAQVLLIAGLAVAVGLGGTGFGPAGWVVGVACGVITNAALAGGLSHYRASRLSPADWVTLARATLAVGVAALVANSFGESFGESAPVTLLVPLAAVALALDFVDGWVARRTRTTGMLGARFDGEVDAFLILVLSVYVARSVGAWVLAIGAARYLFLVAGWPAPWMRASLPPRYWRKVVAATQGVVLTIVVGRRSAARRWPAARSSSPSCCSPSRSGAMCGGCGHIVQRRRLGCPRGLTNLRALPRAPDVGGHAQPSLPCSRSSPCWSCGSPSSLRTSRGT